MPKKYNVGVGLVSGVNGFLNSFMQVKQMKHQQKLQENAFVVQALMRQLEDENISLSQRARILDEIPRLVGARKMDRRLSEMIGISDELLNEPQEPATKGREGTPAQDIVDPNINNPELASSIRLKGTQATSDIPASIEKKGDLTPAIIRKKLILETKKAEDAQDFEKQSRILKLNYDLQMSSLKGTGFSKEVFRGYDKNGNYIVTLANQKGERKDIFLGDVDPDAIVKAQITSNRPSKFLQEREQYWLNQSNPETGNNFSEEEAAAKALEDANKKFGLELKAKEAYSTSLNQGITGTKPIQPAQSVDDRRAIADRKATLRANVNTLNRQAQDASLDAKQKSEQASNHWNNVVEPIKKEMQKWLDDGGETIDPEYTRQQARLNTEINRFNELKRYADDAVSKDNSFKESVRESQDILSEYERGVGVSSSVPEAVQKAIYFVRKKNPTQTKNMSDADIINYLRSKGKLQ